MTTRLRLPIAASVQRMPAGDRQAAQRGRSLTGDGPFFVSGDCTSATAGYRRIMERDRPP